MHILLFIHITQNSQSALFHDAKIPNLALFRESKIPNMRGTGPFPNEAKKIAAEGKCTWLNVEGLTGL